MPSPRSRRHSRQGPPRRSPHRQCHHSLPPWSVSSQTWWLHDSDIQTTSIADWDVISAISGAGSVPADEIVYVPQVEGDTLWDLTDDMVGEETVDAIVNTDVSDSSFLFSYFVGVDENGHMFGGASPEYAAAIRNVDDNLGEILDAVDAWEAAHPGEEWTIIVVTDHGHQPQQGFGHGFQHRMRQRHS